MYTPIKNILTLLFVAFTLIINGQGLNDLSVQEESPSTIDHNFTEDADQSAQDEDSFLRAADANDIPQRTFSNLKDATDGYYVISMVLSSDKNLKRAIKKHKRKGFEPGYIFIQDKGLYYYYLKSYNDWQPAIEDVNSKFDNTYKDNVWILKIDDSEPNRALAVNNSSNQPVLENEISNEIAGNIILEKEVSEKSANKDKLVKRADEYFNKMWYAEAAKLYEMALNKSQDNYSYQVLQKAGDAHYFNTNMEQAYKWYNILYENYSDEMSADNIFKYAHSLKGTGNYARSKKLMRLYNKRLKASSEPASAFNKQREIELDNILNTEKKFDIKNLKINSENSEFSPMFFGEDVVFASAMDSSVFNTRRYKWNNQPYLDLYVSKLNEESQELKNAVKFSKKVNTKYHEASVAFSPDNETMYFTRNNYGKKLKRDKKGINHLKIYRSKKVNGEWLEATEVSFNSDAYSTGHPAISSDGKKMYFVSDMPGSLGETDIFVVDINEDGSFSEPRNLGPEINTEQKEMFPFINDKKFYFSSDGHTGLGGLDVFEASFDAEKGFTEVRNLGKPINSNKDDFSYIVDEETQKGYFASNRDGGKGDDDIYSFKRLVLEEIPENKNAIAGVVTELITGDLMPKAMVELLDENNIKLKEVETAEDGSFIFEDLDSNTRYTLRTTGGDTYFEDERETATEDNTTVNVEVKLRKLQEMITVENGIRKLKTEMIHFNFDKSYIRPDAANELDKLVEVMNEYPDMVIKVESHTDSRGSAVYNKYLSGKRAESTRDYIISKGIAPERIQSATGYGEERLLNGCDGSVACTEQNHYLNRRSEFIIVEM
ncbi:cell envelope biogenesis protein OmpA [Maribacter sp. MJ134]|nr:cell envelope biogenesis protein OmpA [Maribacter sp. MJ134]